MSNLKVDISDEVEFKNGRGNPFGWSQEEIWYKGTRIGWLESGSLDMDEPFYSSEEVKISENKTRGIIYFEKGKYLESMKSGT